MLPVCWVSNYLAATGTLQKNAEMCLKKRQRQLMKFGPRFFENVLNRVKEQQLKFTILSYIGDKWDQISKT